MASLSLACATAAPGSQRASRDICVARRAAAQPKVRGACPLAPFSSDAAHPSTLRVFEKAF